MNKETLQDLLVKNYSLRKIGIELKCSFTTVRYWVKKYKLEKINPCKEGQRYCTICKDCKLEKEFYKKKLGGFYPYCKICTSKQVVEKQRDLKSKCIEYKGGKCINCGYNKSPAALHFHHLDPSQKEFSLGGRKTTSLENMKKEIDKCELLCANCHAEKHESLYITTN